MKFYYYILVYLFVLLPMMASATITVELANPLRISSIQDLLVAILNIIMILMIPVIVFYIIYAGFMYVTARGNAEQIKTATRALTYAIIGGVLVIGAFAIAEIIRATVSSFAAPAPAPASRVLPGDPTAPAGPQ